MLVFILTVIHLLMQNSYSWSDQMSLQSSSFSSNLSGSYENFSIYNRLRDGRNETCTVNRADSGVKYRIDNRRRRRDVKSVCELYRPIRIKAHFVNSRFITNAQQDHLITVVKHITNIVSQLFSVYPVKDRQILKRTSCSRVWDSGINSGKCAYLGRSGGTECQSYPEYCSQDKEFQIPDEHLEGLYVWSNNNANPTVVCREGEGLSDTDYILYVNADATHRCLQQDQNVIGYASHCQLGENDRPIAGYINICPLVLTEAHYQRERVVATALHELLHALGFSVDLFNKLKKCQVVGSSIHCSNRRNTMQTNDHVKRLSTPSVIQAAANHFSGGKARNMIGPALQTVNGVLSSHWDAAQMYGSIMTPSISLPELTSIDNITLAYFEDTGWYCVNYSLADEFWWGRGEGEKFGVAEECNGGDSKYFCSGNNQGCHYMHTHKATCESSPFLHGCRIYRSRLEDSCLKQPPDGVEVKPDEDYQPQSRCFNSNLTLLSSTTEVPTSGRCYVHKCSESGVPLVRVGAHGDFQICPYDTIIKIDGYVGLVQCPRAGILCPTRNRTSLLLSLPAAPPVISSTTSSFNIDEPIYLEISFQSVPSSLLNSAHIRNAFIEATLDWVATRSYVSRERLTDAVFVVSDNSVRFVLQPSSSLTDGPNSEHVITVIQNHITSRQFTVSLRSGGEVFYAKQLRRLNDSRRESEESEENSTSIIVIICVVVSVIVLIAAVCLITRLCRARRRNDTRRNCSNSSFV